MANNLNNTNNSNKFINGIQLVAVNPATGAERILQASIMVPAYNNTLEQYIAYAIANPGSIAFKFIKKEQEVSGDPLFAQLDNQAKQASEQAKQANIANAKQNAYAPQNVPF